MNDLIDRRTLIKDLISDCLKAKEELKYPSIKELYKRIEALIYKQKQIEAKPVVPLSEIYRVIAGHSNYHGDSILSALTCITEGKEVKPIKPLEE